MICFVLWASVLSLFTACRESGSPGGSGTPTPTPSPTVSNPAVGVVDDSAGFYMRYVNTGKFTYDMHKDNVTTQGTTYGTTCTAAVGEIATCFLEGEELDMYFHDLSLQYNVPTDMGCIYVRWTPYYYYTYPVDYSPRTVYVDTDKNSNVGYDEDGDGIIDPIANPDDIAGVDKCELDSGGNLVCTGCPYDYGIVSGPNCCQGGFRKTTRTYDNSKSAYGQAAIADGDWGGKYGNCLGGPAMASQTTTTSGYPRSTLTFVEGVGLNLKYDIVSPINKGFARNLFISNWYEDADLVGSIPPPPLTSQPTQYSFANLPAPQTYYYLQCLDRAFDNIAAIKLWVREWNTQAFFNTRTSSPTSYNDVGAEGGPFAGDEKNDFDDWKDMSKSYPGTNE